MLQAQQQCQNPKITLLSIAQAVISVNCHYAYYNCKLHELSTIPPSITALVCLAVMAWKNISKHTEQLQEWDDTPLRELVQVVLLYGAAHSAYSDDCVLSNVQVLVGTMLFVQQQVRPAPQQQTPTPKSDGGKPGLSPAGRVELLLQTLQLVQQLQQEQLTTSTADVDSSPAARAPTVVTSPTVRAGCTNYAVASGIGAILLLADDQLRKPQQHAGLSPAAAAAEAAVAAAGCDPTPAALLQKAGDLCGVLECFLRAHAYGPLAGGDCPIHDENLRPFATPMHILTLCTYSPDGQPGLLRRLAAEGTDEQETAFFTLLLTLLKLSATSSFNETDEMCSQSRCILSTVAYDLLVCSCNELSDCFSIPLLRAGQSLAAATSASTFSTCQPGGSSSSSVAAVPQWLLSELRDIDASIAVAAAAAGNGSSSESERGGSSSNTSATLWLLLVGRCFLVWAADLAKMQAEGADWVQLIRQAQQQRLPVIDVVYETPPKTTVSFCFASRQPRLLRCAICLKHALREGSSISAGLAAAGYDMGPLLGPLLHVTRACSTLINLAMLLLATLQA
jgi:hypothetical protein